MEMTAVHTIISMIYYKVNERDRDNFLAEILKLTIFEGLDPQKLEYEITKKHVAFDLVIETGAKIEKLSYSNIVKKKTK